MIDTRAAGFREAVEGIETGHTVMVGGFGDAGANMGLVAAVPERGLRDLTVIANDAGFPRWHQ